MYLTTFRGESVKEAMFLAKEECGEEAFIVEVEERSGKVEVVVMLGEEGDTAHSEDIENVEERDEFATYVMQILDKHDCLPRVTSYILEGLERHNVEGLEASGKFASALGRVLQFDSLEKKLRLSKGKNVVILAGPPGVGKTSLCAKFAAKFLLDEVEVCLICSDVSRMGARAQLLGYSDKLGIEMREASSLSEISLILDTLADDCHVFIDTIGINPFRYDEVMPILELSTSLGASTELSLVLNAGRSPYETKELVDAFGKNLRPKRVITTGVDIARRLGSVLTAACESNIALGEVSISPHISDGLYNITPLSLAKLLLNNVSYSADDNVANNSIRKGLE